MVAIRELKTVSSKYLYDLAELHVCAFPNFFLTQLGVRFLRLLYSSYLEDDYSGIIVAEDDSCLVGFLAYSTNYSRFFKGLIKHHIIEFSVYSLKTVVRNPSYLKRLFGAFGKSKSVEKEESYVELASICVDPLIENQGIGTSLIEYLKMIVDFNSYAYINLETDAVGNDGVNAFYIKNGFRLARQFTTSEGRIMNEYRFAPGEIE